MVDKALIMRKLVELERCLGQMREYSSITLDKYSEDWKTQRIVERTLQIMIELCVDTTSHIISDKGLRIPTSYSDTFKVLKEEKLIDEALYQIMERMAKFRNIVVHRYDRIDETIVIGILRKNLDDFLTYRDAILRIIELEG